MICYFTRYVIQVLVVMKSHMYIGDRSTDAPLDASCGLNNVLCMESVPRQANPNPATEYELQCNCYSYYKIPLKAALDEVASSLVIKPHQYVQG